MQIQSLGDTDYMIPELDPNFLDGSLGLADEELRAVGEELAGRFLLFPADLEGALGPFSKEDRQTIIAAFLAAGGDPSIVESATRRKVVKVTFAVLSTASMAAGAYHGYRRNQSIGWALWWAFMGGLFPVFTPAIAVAQGFGDPK